MAVIPFDVIIRSDRSGARNIRADLTDAAKAADQVGKESERASKSAQRGIKSVGDAAKRSASISRRELKDTQRQAQMATRSISGHVSTLTKQFGGLRNAIAASLGGFFLIRTFQNFIGNAAKVEDVIGQIQVAGGEGADKLKMLSDRIAEIASRSRFAESEVASAALTFTKAGFNYATTATALEPTLRFAIATSTELGNATNLAAEAMNGLKLEAEDLEGVYDVLIQTQRNAQVDIDSLRGSMRETLASADELGISVEELGAVFGVMGNAAIRDSRAGIHFRLMLQALNSDSKQVIETLGKYGLTMDDVNIKQRGLQAVLQDLAAVNIDFTDSMKIFNARAGNTALAVLRNVRTFDSLLKSNREANGLLEEASDIMERKLMQALKNVQSALENVGNQFTRTFNDQIIGVLGAISNVLNFVAGNISGFAGLAAIFAAPRAVAITAALGGALILAIRTALKPITQLAATNATLYQTVALATMQKGGPISADEIVAAARGTRGAPSVGAIVGGRRGVITSRTMAMLAAGFKLLTRFVFGLVKILPLTVAGLYLFRDELKKSAVEGVRDLGHTLDGLGFAFKKMLGITGDAIADFASKVTGLDFVSLTDLLARAFTGLINILAWAVDGIATEFRAMFEWMRIVIGGGNERERAYMDAAVKLNKPFRADIEAAEGNLGKLERIDTLRGYIKSSEETTRSLMGQDTADARLFRKVEQRARIRYREELEGLLEDTAGMTSDLLTAQIQEFRDKLLPENRWQLAMATVQSYYDDPITIMQDWINQGAGRSRIDMMGAPHQRGRRADRWAYRGEYTPPDGPPPPPPPGERTMRAWDAFLGEMRERRNLLREGDILNTRELRIRELIGALAEEDNITFDEANKLYAEQTKQAREMLTVLRQQETVAQAVRDSVGIVTTSFGETIKDYFYGFNWREFGSDIGQRVADGFVDSFVDKFTEGFNNASDYLISVIQQATTEGDTGAPFSFGNLARSFFGLEPEVPGSYYGGMFKLGGRPGRDRNMVSYNGRPVTRASSDEYMTIHSPRGGGMGQTVYSFEYKPTIQSTGDPRRDARTQKQVYNRFKRDIVRDMAKNQRNTGNPLR